MKEKGEKLESNFSELEEQKVTGNRRTEELEAQNNLLEEQLKVSKENVLGITQFCSQACLMQKKIHRVHLKLVEELYRIKQIEVRLKEITDTSPDFGKGVLEVVERIRIQLT